jgi:hypothetical protein
LKTEDVLPQRREGRKERNARFGAFFFCRVTAKEKASLSKTVTRFLTKYTLPLLSDLGVLSKAGG